MTAISSSNVVAHQYGERMANSEITVAAKALAEELGAVLWDDIPLGGPEVVWPDADVRSFAEKVRRLAPTVVYLSPDSDVIAVAIAGVVHVFDPDEQRFGETSDDRELGDRFRISLDRGSEDELSPAMQELANQIAADERFDGEDADDLIDQSGMDIDPGLYQEIGWAAGAIFREGIGGRLEKESRGIVRELIKHPEFDPLADNFRDEESHPYIDEAVAGRDPRLKRTVQRGLQEAIWNNGLRDKAEREVKEEASRLIDFIPRLVLDQVGFASRRATRDALLAPFLNSMVEHRRDMTGYWIKRLDGDRAQVKREARYALASQRLLSAGVTKRTIASQLQLSLSTLERLLAIRSPAVSEFEPDDPIVAELAPELRRATGGS